jgi:hypothetical protein
MPRPAARSARPPPQALAIGLGLLLAGAVPCATAQVRKCDDLRDQIDGRLMWPKGSYELQILPREQKTEAKFLGQCEGGTRKIVAFRKAGSAEAQLAAIQAAVQPVTPAAELPVRRNPLPVPRPPAAAPVEATAPAPAPAAPVASAAVEPPKPVEPVSASAPVATASAAPAPPAAPASAVAAAAASAAVASPDVVASVASGPAAAIPAYNRQRVLEQLIEIQALPTQRCCDVQAMGVSFDMQDSLLAFRKQLADVGESVAVAAMRAEVVEVQAAVSPKLDIAQPDPQLVVPGVPARWEFLLSPPDEGSYTVTFSFKAHLVKGGKPFTFAEKSQVVQFERTLKDKALRVVTNKDYQWLWTTVLIPLVVYGWRNARSRSQGAAEKAA